MHLEESDLVEKLETGITGFDQVALGGLPKYRTTLVTGSAGSGKTIFAVQFLANGIINSNESGVFVTFEESAEDIRRNMRVFGWDIKKWEEEGKWVFVDVSRRPEDGHVVIGDFDLGGLLVRIEYAVRKSNATRASLDSLAAIFSQFDNAATVRSELFRVASSLKKMGVTSVMTAERTEEYGPISRFGVEEFVADNVVILRNVLDEEKRRRTVEILKFRGTNHQKGEHPYTIVQDHGIVGISLSAITLMQNSSDLRITSGIPELDEMCGGGFFQDSILLVSGATGTGKTLTVTMFMAGGISNCERCLLFAFEESREQLYRNAKGWGIDFEKLEGEGKLKIVCRYPETLGLEEHLLEMQNVISDFSPTRVAVDSLSALERVSNVKSFREFVISLTSFIKHKEIAGLFTSTTPTLMGGSSVTETHISTITDSIILLRYVEVFGEMRRGITVLKMRGSMHDKSIREFTIDNKGIHISDPFMNVTGVLTGNFVHIKPDENKRITNMFKEDTV